MAYKIPPVEGPAYYVEEFIKAAGGASWVLAAGPYDSYRVAARWRAEQASGDFRITPRRRGVT